MEDGDYKPEKMLGLAILIVALVMLYGALAWLAWPFIKLMRFWS